MRQRGFSLVEVLLVAGIIVMMTAIAVGMSQSSRPLGVSATLNEFDAVVFYARQLAASSGNGATLVFERRPSGFEAKLYSGRPNAAGAMQPANMVPMSGTAEISEANIGAPPFTLFFNASGHVTGMKGAADPAVVIAKEPPCPDADYHLHFTFTDGRITQRRTLTCARDVVGAALTPVPTKGVAIETPTPVPQFTIVPVSTPAPSVMQSSSPNPTASPAPRTASPVPSPAPTNAGCLGTVSLGAPTVAGRLALPTKNSVYPSLAGWNVFGDVQLLKWSLPAGVCAGDAVVFDLSVYAGDGTGQRQTTYFGDPNGVAVRVWIVAHETTPQPSLDTVLQSQSLIRWGKSTAIKQPYYHSGYLLAYQDYSMCAAGCNPHLLQYVTAPSAGQNIYALLYNFFVPPSFTFGCASDPEANCTYKTVTHLVKGPLYTYQSMYGTMKFVAAAASGVSLPYADPAPTPPAGGCRYPRKWSPSDYICE